MADNMHPDTATQAAALLWQHRRAGSKLAAANAAGLDAIGVELSPKRAARARELGLAPPE